MLARERVLAAVEFRTPDKIPIQINTSADGLYEHQRVRAMPPMS